MREGPAVALIGRFSLDDVRNKQTLRSLNALGYRPLIVNPPGGYLQRSLGQIRALRRVDIEVVIVPFLGYSSVPVAWLISRVRHAPLVFDAFILLHDTLVVDRQVVPRRSLRSALLRLLEAVSCRLADVVLVDTDQHLERFAKATRSRPDHFAVVPVGSEHRTPCEEPRNLEAGGGGLGARPVHVVYCGSFIPLHGLEHVVRAAAALLPRSEITFTFVGGGQLEGSIRRLAQDLGCSNCRFVGPLYGAELRELLCRATIILGVFGTSMKALVVVPNKVVDGLALARPVLTASTPAIEAALATQEYLGCPPGDPAALAAVLTRAADGDYELEAIARAGHAAYERGFSDRSIADALGQALARVDRSAR